MSEPGIGSGGYGMTISLVMGDRRTKRNAWGGAGPNGPKRHRGSLGQPSSDDPDEDGSPPEWSDRSMFTSENDLALAKMMGCAFLFGIACIVGLLVLLF